jgi:hypothetical protein
MAFPGMCARGRRRPAIRRVHIFGYGHFSSFSEDLGKVFRRISFDRGYTIAEANAPAGSATLNVAQPDRRGQFPQSDRRVSGPLPEHVPQFPNPEMILPPFTLEKFFRQSQSANLRATRVRQESRTQPAGQSILRRNGCR